MCTGTQQLVSHDLGIRVTRNTPTATINYNAHLRLHRSIHKMRKKKEEKRQASECPDSAKDEWLLLWRHFLKALWARSIYKRSKRFQPKRTSFDISPLGVWSVEPEYPICDTYLTCFVKSLNHSLTIYHPNRRMLLTLQPATYTPQGIGMDAFNCIYNKLSQPVNQGDGSVWDGHANPSFIRSFGTLRSYVGCRDRNGSMPCACSVELPIGRRRSFCFWTCELWRQLYKWRY